MLILLISYHYTIKLVILVVYRYNAGEPHRSALKWLFEKRLLLMSKYENPPRPPTNTENTPEKTLMLVAHQGDKIVGACGLEPCACKSTLYDQISVGLLLIPFYFGYTALKRIFELGASAEMKENEKINEKVSENENENVSRNKVKGPKGAVVSMMAVDPAYQGEHALLCSEYCRLQ